MKRNKHDQQLTGTPKMRNISRHSNTGNRLVYSGYWKPQLHFVTHMIHTSNTGHNTSFGIYSSKDLRHENNWNNVLKETLTSTQGCRRKKKSCNSVAWSRLFVKGKKQEVIQEDTFHALNSFLYLSFMGLWIAANTSAAAVSDSHTGLASTPVINSKDLSLRLRQDRRRWIRLPSSFTESFI